MGYKMKLERICQYCGDAFIAQTVQTKYCSHRCNQRHYKEKKRMDKAILSNKETLTMQIKPIEYLNAKDFLTVREVATLLNCSVRTVYYQIEQGKIKATNLGERLTRIKRSDIDSLFKHDDSK